jgi:hypothetical protein
MQIFIHRDGHEYGPYSQNQICEFLADGSIIGDDYCRADTDTEWSTVTNRLEHLLPAKESIDQLPPETDPATAPVLELTDVPHSTASSTNEEESSFQVAVIERETTLTCWDEIALPPLIQGASPSSTSKIMMGIECIRREDYERALNLFHASLEETHTVASAWLGIAYAEAYLASIERNTVKNIRHAVNKAHEFCPTKQKRISDHHGTILTLALGQVAVISGMAYFEHLKSLSSAQQGLVAQQNAANKRAAAIAVGSVAAVLGGRSKGSIGKMIGYGIAANQALRATDAHGLAHQSQMQVEDDLRRSRSSHDLAAAFASLTSDIIKEAREIYFECNPKVQGIIDSHIESMSSALLALENVKTEVKGTPTIQVSKQNHSCGCFVIILIIVSAILLLIALLLSVSNQ